MIARFGVHPKQIPDYLVLVSDVSDGLPGIAGWGPKSAAAVLSRYGSIESIPRDGEWDVQVRGGERLARTLDRRWLEAVLCRDLSILRTNLPIPHTIADLEWRGAHREELTQLSDTLGETDVLDHVPLFNSSPHDTSWAVPNSPDLTPLNPPELVNEILRPNFARVKVSLTVHPDGVGSVSCVLGVDP